MLKKFLIFPPIIIGLIILIYLVNSTNPPSQTPPNERISYVRVITVQPTDFIPKAIGYGNVEPGRVWNAVAQVSGQIEYVHPQFKKGAVLQAGTEIIRISTKDYEIAIAQANANIRSAKAKLQELDVTLENNKKALEIEEKALAIKQKELARKNKLLQKGTIAQASIDQEQRDVLQQEKKVIDLKNAIRLMPAQKLAQQEQVAVNQTQLDTAELNLARTSIKLPFPALISETNVEITQYVGVGTTLGKADGIKIAEIDAQFPITHLSRMVRASTKTNQMITAGQNTFKDLTKRLGLHAIVRLKTGLLNTEWKGQVVRISDTVDPKTRSIGIIVNVVDHYKEIIPGKRPPLFKGAFVEVELRTNSAKKKIILPRSAVHNSKVYIVNKENRLEIRQVQPDLIQGNLAIFENDIKPGEKIVVSDLTSAIPNMLLETQEDETLVKRLKNEASSQGEIK